MDWKDYPPIKGVSPNAQRLIDEQLKLAFMSGVEKSFDIFRTEVEATPLSVLTFRPKVHYLFEKIGVAMTMMVGLVSAQGRP